MGLDLGETNILKDTSLIGGDSTFSRMDIGMDSFQLTTNPVIREIEEAESLREESMLEESKAGSID